MVYLQPELHVSPQVLSLHAPVEAMSVLFHLDADTLAQASPALAQLLEHEYWPNRCMALSLLGRLHAVALAQHTQAVVRALADEERDVREEAANTFRELKAAELSQHIVATLV